MQKCVASTLSISVITLLIAVPSIARCPQADLTGDCIVDIRDAAVLADRWLEHPESAYGGPDLNADDYVNMDDFTLLAGQWLKEGIPLAINEVMAANSRTIWDEKGHFDDWVEIYNYGSKAIDTAGMYLTDDLEQPKRWRILLGNPALTTIQSGGYLLIWVDGEPNSTTLHANFELDAGGDDVALFAGDGKTLVDHVSFGDQTTDVSYGRFRDANDSFFSMILATPRGSNVYFYEGIVQDPQVSYSRGFYDASFMLTIAAETEGAAVYYTLNGGSPYDYKNQTIKGTMYSGPIPIAKTTCVRAVAFKSRWQPSKTITRSYIFVNDVKTQSPSGQAPGPGWPTGSVNGQVLDYGMDPDIVNSAQYRDLIDDALLAIPSLSLVTDLENLFDPSKGMYVNAKGDGRTWERPVSVELIDPSGADGFQINAGLRIRGGYSRSSSNPKHAFRLFFRPDYGESKLKFALFGDEGVDEFKNVDLRCSQNYSWSYGGDTRNTDVREVFSRDAQKEMGQPYTRSRYYHLYLNGHYWGLFQTQERSEASYAASYLGGDKEDYDVVKATGGNPDWIGYVIEATDGTLDAFRRLWEVASTGFDTDEAYYRVQGLNTDGTRNPAYEKLVDVDNLIDYMICVFYVGDFDAPISGFISNSVPNNFYCAYNRVNPDGFKYFRHDAEHSLMPTDSRNYDRTGPYPAGQQFQHFNPQWLHQQLVAHPEYRMRFADRILKHFFNGGVFTPEQSQARIRNRAGQIETAMIAESARWGDAKRHPPLNRDDHWWPEINMLLNSYLPARTNIVLGQLKGKGWYPSVVAPSFDKHGGSFAGTVSLTMTAPAGKIYYTLDGTDPRLPGHPTGTAGTTTLVAADNPKRVLIPSASVNDDWRSSTIFDDSGWAYVSGSPGGVGYERETGYEGLISLDLNSQMYGKNTSCYVRIPFIVSDPSGFNFMTLKMRYDDGFVAYLNGQFIYAALFDGTPAWNSKADGNHEDGGYESFNVSGYIKDLKPGLNILAIHAMNYSATSSDFLVLPELVVGRTTSAAGGGVAPSAIEYTDPMTLTKSALVKSRSLVGATWSALNEAVFAVGQVKENLRITEIMYHPCDANNPTDPNDPNEEFIELKNIGPQTINLNLVKFTNGIDFTFGDVNLAPGAYTVIVENKTAFQARYGTTIPIAGQYTGKLDNAGERIQLVDAVGTTILDFKYADGWRDVTDGQGYSLTIINPANPDANSWDMKDCWRASVYAGGSPGSDDSGLMPNPGDVVINEVLAHAHAEASDWIELHNTTGKEIDIGGWFLSDANDDLFKYEIAAGTKIPAYGYKVFYEGVNFGNASFDPGKHVGFALSENGEKLYLTGALDSFVTGYRDVEEFGASLRDISFGRYFKKSTGTSNFVALSYNTPWLGNSYPKVGPIVISEIMYNPDWPAVGAYTNDSYEYVELRNITDAPVALYQYDRQEAWRFTEGIEYQFAGVPNEVTIPAGGYIVVVRNVGAFSWRYPEVSVEKIYGPYTGALDNAGEKLELSMPGDVDRFGVRQWIRIDRVVYSDGSHADGESAVDLWPTAADGLGSSLQRLSMTAYGNDPNNWTAAAPTPAR